MWKKNYTISGEEVLSLTNFFLVEKYDYIMMVYNCMPNVLNVVLWSPNFTLPTMSTQMRSIQLGTSMGDIFISKMFLNFTIHKILRKRCGLDVMHIWSEDTKFSDQE